jgi:hypothetical protein
MTKEMIKHAKEVLRYSMQVSNQRRMTEIERDALIQAYKVLEAYRKQVIQING